ncbi:LicD family protein (phosphorylcholine metabolism) [Legionella gratiana]|uniref:LicD family protein (Phosphorylcholine metabolism) n=1 Tax=Legionella gratiana TaxID=45066 RepID=A0A378JE00_9GAMM|nr:LicD family protein [Legionella gratiana]KTD09108.1 LicD family protein (phosphorylcholine metabolism) [Legionella gratiana]STX45679.1 LicD family protein (phosphorylcholine metabolism) [Legionella gratiana]
MTLAQQINPYSAESAFSDGRLRQAQLKMLAMLEVIDSICLKHNLDYWLDAGTLLGAVRHQGFIPWDDDVDIAMPRASYEQFLRVAPEEIPDFMWLQTIHSDPGYFNMATPLKIRDRCSRFIEKHEKGNEPYVQGIFIDVFVYDNMPVDPKQRKRYKFYAKKLSRLLSTKYSKVKTGHYPTLYKTIASLLPKSLLEFFLEKIIYQANTSKSPYVGRGYNCVGNNLIKHDEIYPLQRVIFETKEFNIPNNAETFLIQQYGDYWTIPPEDQRTMRHCKELIPHLNEMIG